MARASFMTRKCPFSDCLRRGLVNTSPIHMLDCSFFLATLIHAHAHEDLLHSVCADFVLYTTVAARFLFSLPAQQTLS